MNWPEAVASAFRSLSVVALVFGVAWCITTFIKGLAGAYDKH